MTNKTPKDILKEAAKDFEDLKFCALAGMEVCEMLSQEDDVAFDEPETLEAVLDIFAGLNGVHDMLVCRFLEFFATR